VWLRVACSDQWFESGLRVSRYHDGLCTVTLTLTGTRDSFYGRRSTVADALTAGAGLTAAADALAIVDRVNGIDRADILIKV
jgi:hypothetical protein